MADRAEGASGPGPSASTPTRSSRRAQAAIDSGVALVLAMLAWPFPLARAALPPAVHVVSLLVFWQLLQMAYFAVTMAVWGATAGTHLMGLRVVADGGAAPSRGQRAWWGVLSGALALVRIVAPVREGARDVPERAAGVDVVKPAPGG